MELGSPPASSHHTANDVGRWVETQDDKGMAPGPDPSFLPLAPAENFPADPSGSMKRLIDIWQGGRAYEYFSPDRIKLGKEIFQITDEEIQGPPTVAFTGSKRGIFLNRNNVKNQSITHIRDHYGFTAWAYYFEDGIDNLNHPGNVSKYSKSVSFVGGR